MATPTSRSRYSKSNAHLFLALLALVTTPNAIDAQPRPGFSLALGGGYNSYAEIEGLSAHGAICYSGGSLFAAATFATAVTAAVATAVPATIAIAVAGKGRLLKIERCQGNRRDRGDHEGGQKSTNGWAHCCFLELFRVGGRDASNRCLNLA